MKKRQPKSPVRSGWEFSPTDESFTFDSPEKLSRMYFPLCNEAGILSSITPTLNGDIKRDQNHFLTLPVSVEDLHNSRASRNFWIFVDGKEPWSASGSAAGAQAARFSQRGGDFVRLEAGALWHTVQRQNKALGLHVELVNFAPATSDLCEIMQVYVKNTGRKPITFTPTAAIPIYGRSADNLRDHRHVTSLLHRIALVPQGVLVTPTMSFDERGHKINTTVYAVLGVEEDGKVPQGLFPTVDSFIGEGGSFDAPQAVYKNLPPRKLSSTELQGREAVGGLRFGRRTLAPGKTAIYTLMMGIADDRKQALRWLGAYGTREKVYTAFQGMQERWQERLDTLVIRTADRDFDRWLRWVSLQPVLRKIFGCSFLPDFDYGRGGRGWRDLWQDCLALLLLEPATGRAGESASRESDGVTASPARPLADLPVRFDANSVPADGAARELLLQNFGGVRMNGSNATIIGRNPGEFIADRNNISRTWMDHGAWPWITTELYIHQTGDLDLLFADVPYFWDQDQAATPSAEKGSVLEHILVQHLTSYFDVGDHGNIRLRDADWNDGLDMAHEHGESVAFTAVFAGNLLRLAQALSVAKDRHSKVRLAAELEVLLEEKTHSTELVPEAKRLRLATYQERIRNGVSGEKVTIPIQALIDDLKLKGETLAAHVRSKEWLPNEGGNAWFNGYYDNNGLRVEGHQGLKVRMTLTGQVFPIMSGVATDDQVRQTFSSVKKHLYDRELEGFRLNTDFGEIQPALGRAFSFAYGEKENGAVFSHMVTMFANALYGRGFSEEGYEALMSLYRMAKNVAVSKIYPCLPEYFNGEGRGLYLYLTGSASWYVLTVVTQMMGVRGLWGQLLLSPKLMAEQFDENDSVTVSTLFAEKQLEVVYRNPRRKSIGQYRIESVQVGEEALALPEAGEPVLIPRRMITEAPSPRLRILVELA